MTPEERAQKLHRRLEKFPAELFRFDDRIREGWLSDRYFVRTIRTLEHAGRDPEVLMQLFAKKTGVLAGVYEVIRLLQTQLTSGYDPRDLTIHTLTDGDLIEGWEPVMWVQGPYRAFAHLETVMDGILARRTLVASNAHRAVEAAGGKPVLYFGPRHDDWRVQVADGYAANVGGAGAVSSDAGGEWWGERGVGTMPHALIAAMGGDVVEATLAFARYVKAEEPEVRLVSLTDYDNHVVRDSLRVARAMEEEFGPGHLEAVRVDTSGRLVDQSLIGDPDHWGVERLTGVNPPLIRKLRRRLDEEGFEDVGIVASGGFTPAKIKRFERADVPVDSYGVGSSLLGHGSTEDEVYNSFDFTADVVEVEGEPEHKVGRGKRSSDRLAQLNWEEIL